MEVQLDSTARLAGAKASPPRKTNLPMAMFQLFGSKVTPELSTNAQWYCNAVLVQIALPFCSNGFVRDLYCINTICTGQSSHKIGALEVKTSAVHELRCDSSYKIVEPNRVPFPRYIFRFSENLCWPRADQDQEEERRQVVCGRACYPISRTDIWRGSGSCVFPLQRSSLLPSSSFLPSNAAASA